MIPVYTVLSLAVGPRAADACLAALADNGLHIVSGVEFTSYSSDEWGNSERRACVAVDDKLFRAQMQVHETITGSEYKTHIEEMLLSQLGEELIKDLTT